jgi:SAM-dependent methyltransferase
MSVLNKIENIFYQRILKYILFSSRLARRSILGLSDSGVTFDYIYNDRASGYRPIGKLIDSIVLKLPSAKAVKTRKNYFKNILKSEIKKNIKIDKKTRIVDLASGPARYLVESISDSDTGKVEVLCLDIDKRSLNYGKKISAGKPIRYTKGDVFNLSSYKNISKKVGWSPNVVIASGLYNFVNENSFFLSLKDVFDNLSEGGLFVFDNLIRNPNEKLLQKIAVNRKNMPWTFVYRKPDTVKKLLYDIGFKEVKMDIDLYNVFAIYSGRK